MKLTRRAMMGSALAAPAIVTVPASLSHGATIAPPEEQNAGWYRFALGDFQITVLSDGNLVTPTGNMAPNVPREEVVGFLNDRFLDAETNRPHTNHILIDTGDARVLVDVGSGERFMPSAGKLSGNLDEAGIDPGDITHVALTHAHPDHVWGMLDEFDEIRIPDAEYAISAAEFDWWTGEDRVNQVPEPMQAMVVGAQNALTPVAEQTTMVTDGAEIVPGVRMIDTPGHTPGHMGVMVESGGAQMLVAGDAINHAYISFEHPDWHGGFDMDKDQAVATRKRLLDMCATDRLLLAGFHLPFPGVGHVIRRGDAYQYLPAPWAWSE